MSKIEARPAVDPFSIANPVRLLKDIAHPIEIEQVGESAGNILSALITQRLEQGEMIVINDGTNDVVYSILPIAEKQIEVTKIHRGYPKDEPKIFKETITNYEINAEFIKGAKSKELSLSLEQIEEGKPQRCIFYNISSAGNKRPRPFEIYANNEILLARSSEGSLTCVMEYRTPAVWFTNGNAFKNVKQV